MIERGGVGGVCLGGKVQLNADLLVQCLKPLLSMVIYSVTVLRYMYVHVCIFFVQIFF